MSPLPSRCSAPITSSTVRESTRVATRKLMRDGKFALIRPVITSTLGRCVASTRCMPTARAICARRVTLLRRWRVPASSDRPARRSRSGCRESAPVPLPPTRLLRTGCAAGLAAGAPSCCTDRCCGRPCEASSFKRRSISSTALRSALVAFLAIGDHRRQQMRNAFVQARIRGASGSTMIMRTWCGVAL